jgi:hypothetical protein
LVSAALLAACSSDTSDREQEIGGSAGVAGTGGASASAGASGNAGFGNPDPTSSSPVTIPDGGPSPGPATGDGSLDEGNACGVGMATAMLTPVNMLVMFDRSGSMEDDDKWPNATAALSTFLRDPGTDGLGVALRFFPHDEPAEGCTEDGCDAQACSEPLVDIGTLLAEPAPMDTHEAQLIGAIEASPPNDDNNNGGGGGTPIYAALDGALRWATAYEEAHADQSTVVIFVTDGEPNGCDEDFDNISQLASDAHDAAGIATFAIGLEGSSEEQMDQLAQAGGTDSGIFISNSANAEEELLAALNMIRGLTLSCDFPMPEPIDQDTAIDPARVNVTFTPSSGPASTLPQVDGEGACASTTSWHYDDAANPTRIMLCPAACDLARGDAEGMLQILLGCETVCGGLDVDCGEPPPELPPIMVQ